MFGLRKSGRSSGLVVGALVCLLWGPGLVAADTIIDTTPGNSIQNAWGPSSTYQYGQVITVPTTDSVLDSFSLTFTVSGIFSFNADVAAWNATQATGSLLFSSAQTTTDVGASHTYLIDTGHLALTAGSQYVLFFDAYGGSGSGSGDLSARSDNPYSGGLFVYANNHSDALTTGQWVIQNGSNGVDAAFVAHFSAVPAPSTLWGSLALLTVLGIITAFRQWSGSVRAFG